MTRAAALGPGGRGFIEYGSLVAGSVTADLGEIQVRVASPAHLHDSKIGTRRPRDIRAREALERLASELAQT
jgi:hypothetical protein